MIWKPRKLGQASLNEEILVQDKKHCRKYGPCGVGEQALYLNSFYIDRFYYVPFSSVTRIFKRIAMSKGGFTGKGLFASIPYLVVEYDNGQTRQCIFKYEEEIDRLLDDVKTARPDLPLHSLEAEKRLAEKERLLAKKRKTVISETAAANLQVLESCSDYLKKRPELCAELSLSAKRKRSSDRSGGAYQWAALAIVLLGIAALVYGIYSVAVHAGGAVYFLLFGFAAIFFFSGANVLPTAKNNKRAVEKRMEQAVRTLESYIAGYPDFPLPARYAHPVVLKRLGDILSEGRAETIPDALKILKLDLKALNSDVTVEQEEYDEIVAIKPIFLVMNYE